MMDVIAAFALFGGWLAAFQLSIRHKEWLYVIISGPACIASAGSLIFEIVELLQK